MDLDHTNIAFLCVKTIVCSDSTNLMFRDLISCIQLTDYPHLAFVTMHSYKHSTNFRNNDSIPPSTFNNKFCSISFSLQHSHVQVKLSLCTPWMNMKGRWTVPSIANSTLDRVSGQLHNPAAYPRGSSPVTTNTGQSTSPRFFNPQPGPLHTGLLRQND